VADVARAGGARPHEEVASPVATSLTAAGPST
jgi:hypothetical protein